ncbi:hypothetical protein ACJIZ3_020696 [Penstemon smallii]|uniref:TRF2/HOY1 PH-like domain-containing protein n=1 Tax=Penstemon smallii TaxID=265156 RepID=A0ABD3SJK4_9LAMI
MGSLHFDKVEDFTEEEYGSLSKRSRFATAPLNQLGPTKQEFPVSPSQYNPLDEPSPLGLRLRKTPSLLDLIQMRLSQGSSSSSETINSGTKKDVKGIASSSANDKLKASNFPGSLLRIGNWEYKSKYEGDLVAKCYFAKHKLVWEVLDGGLKNKLEIQWSDITGVKADLDDNGPGTLILVLARPPTFFRETNPQPRKHTLWQTTPDFTDGEASINKKHYIECPPGVLNKHYEKLIQCDMRLNILSQQPEIVIDSPFFESQVTVLEIPDELKEAPSPSSSVMDTNASEGNGLLDEHDSEQQTKEKDSEAPGLRPSMSMSDLMNHIGNCISEKVTSGSLPSDKAFECHDMLQNIAQVLLSDTQNAMTTSLDEKSLMKKVNSLCCLLEDPNVQADGENYRGSVDNGKNVVFDLVNDSKHEKASEGSSKDGTPGMKRKDSFGDFLLHLPRIASLPKFLRGIAEDDEY